MYSAKIQIYYVGVSKSIYMCHSIIKKGGGVGEGVLTFLN